MNRRQGFRRMRGRFLGVGLVCALFLPGADSGYATWYAREENVFTGFKTPESVLPVPEKNVAFVSNIETATRGYWASDAEGFISKLRIGESERVENLRWFDSTPAHVLNAPKGLCLFQGALFAADIDRVLQIPLDGAAGGFRVIRVLRARLLNDVATDGKYVYVSDTSSGKIFRLNLRGIVHREIPAPPSVNGITFHGGRMFAVSWELHEVFEIDPKGVKPPAPFGVAAHFWSLDGIVVLDDGSFLVSDFKQNKVSIIAPDRTTVRTLIRVSSPADIGLDRKHMRLYVPQFMQDTVRVYRLTTKKPPPENILKLEEMKKSRSAKPKDAVSGDAASGRKRTGNGER